MNESQEQFRDRLLGAEKTTPSSREKYQRELAMLIDQSLTKKGKWQLTAQMIGCAIVGTTAAVLFMLPARWLALSGLQRLLLAVAAVFVLGKAVLLFRILKRGTVNLKTDSSLHANLQWLLARLAFVICLLISLIDEPEGGVQMLCVGLAVLVFGGVYQIQHSIGAADLQTREKLLGLECQLAELREELQMGRK